MSKHTPGPWWTTDHGVRSREGYIAHTHSVLRYRGQDERFAFEVAQREADKRLIAAAPNGLAAAIKALDECCDLIGTEAGNALQAFIDEATGSSA